MVVDRYDEGNDRVAGTIEAAKRNPIAGLLACAAGLAVVLVLAHWVDPFPGWDKDLLLAIRAAPGTFANDVAFAVERLVSPLAQVGWTVLAAPLALWLRPPTARPFRRRRGRRDSCPRTAAEDRPRAPSLPPHFRRPVLLAPGGEGLPSGNSAGAPAIALAFLLVVPRPWRPVTAAIGAAFTLAVSVGLLVLDYHYPSDILGGWLVSLGCCFALVALQR